MTPSDKPQSQTGAKINSLTTEDRVLNAIVKQQETSWCNNCPQSVSQLLELYAHQTGHPAESEVVLELVSTEIYMRQIQGMRPTLTEYQLRFPDLSEALAIQWEVNELIDEATQSDLTSTLVDDVEHDSSVLSERMIGRYAIIRTIGNGSMGVVYEAWDPGLKRIVALKGLRSSSNANAEEQLRMRSEAEAIAHINHPNIVQVFDVGVSSHGPFLTMEYCVGGNLADRLKGQPLDPWLAAEFVTKIAGGVAAAHACRIIHRDLKPANVLLDSIDGWNPKVADFGLAKLLDGDFTATATEHILGTPAYMSPEQAFGNSRNVGPLADVYALGAILYECLTGRPPFRGVTIADTLDQVRNLQPVPVRRLEPSVPFDLETITSKCLEKEPANRYASVADLIDDLQRFMMRAPIKAKRERFYRTAYRVVRRYPTVSSLALATVSLLVTIAVGSMLFAQRLVKSEAAAKLGQADALVGRAHGIRLSQSPGQRFEALAAIRKAVAIAKELKLPIEWFENTRDEAIGALLLPDAIIDKIFQPASPIQFSDFSDDHQLYAAVYKTGDVAICRMADNQSVMTLPRLNAQSGIEFVGNDKLLQFSDPLGEIELWNLATKPARRMWNFDSLHGKAFSCCVVHPSHSIVAISNETTVKIVEMETGAILNTIPIDNSRPTVFHPTKEQLLVCNRKKLLAEIVDWRSGAIVQQLSFPQLSTTFLVFHGGVWSNNGSEIVLTGENGGHAWLMWNSALQQYELKRTTDVAAIATEGGATVRFATNRDMISKGWSNRVALLCGQTGEVIMASERIADTQYSLEPRVDPQSNLFGLVKPIDEANKAGWLKIAYGVENSMIIPTKSRNALQAKFDPLARFLVTRVDDDIVFADVGTRRVVFKLPIRGTESTYMTFDGGGHIYVDTIRGALKWPYWFSGPSKTTLNLGVPQRTHFPFGNGTIDASDDGGAIVGTYWNGYEGSEYAGVWLKTTEEPAPRRLSIFQSAVNGKVAPNGKWIVYALAAKSYLYDVEQAKIVYDSESNTHNDFDASSRCVLMDGKVIDLQTGIGRTCFGDPRSLSRDGKFLTSSKGANQVCLSRVDDGKVVARFEGVRGGWECLSSCGRYLLTKTPGGFRIADLPLIRQQVLDLGLPWDGPDFSSAKTMPVEQVLVDERLSKVANCDDLWDVVDAEALALALAEPSNGDRAFSASMIYVDRRDWKQALTWIDRACDALPTALTPRLWRAYIYAADKQWSQAISDADWVIDRFPCPELMIQRAEWLYQNGNFERAKSDCQWVISNSKRWSFSAYGIRSLCHKALGDADSAERDYNDFLKQSKSDDVSLLNAIEPMADGDIALWQPFTAKLLLDKASKLGIDENDELRFFRALVEFRNGQIDRALEISQAITKEKQNAYLGHALALTSSCLSVTGKAIAAREFQHQLDSYLATSDLDVHSANRIRLLRNEAVQYLRASSASN